MTNGEKLCIDFPNMRYTIFEHRVITTIGVAASFDLDWWNAEYKEPTTKNDLAYNLCNSCTNIGCKLKSVIAKTACAFYMPPHIEPDNCGNYIVQNPTTKNDLGVDAVTRQAVIDTIFAECSGTKLDIDFAKVLMLQRAIKALSPATPQPRKGHWTLLDECSNSGYYCSECHKKVVKEGWSSTVKKIKYCPNCGSRNEVEKRQEKN